MKLFRFLAYSFAFLLGAVFAFRGGNSFPAPPPKQYKPHFVSSQPTLEGDVVGLPALDEQEQLGKALFLTNCATCHNRNMKNDMTGPALAGVAERWAPYPKEDLYKWIRNSQAMIEAEHPKAVELWSEWNKTIMTSFVNLSDEDIDAILAYVSAQGG